MKVWGIISYFDRPVERLSTQRGHPVAYCVASRIAEKQAISMEEGLVAHVVLTSQFDDLGPHVFVVLFVFVTA